MTSSPAVIPPGGTLGILGGGQLGRMTALAAARLGYRCHIFTPEADSPAAQVSATTTVAAWSDEAALKAFAAAVDVVTLEFENVPLPTLHFLAQRVPVRPGARALEIGQDRVLEKTFFNRFAATAPWQAVESLEALRAAVATIGTPSILKTARLGYDGKGQARIESGSDLAAVWQALGSDHAILEGFVDFECEVSVIVARSLSGQVAAYCAVENSHAHHILDTTTVPADIPGLLAGEAEAVAIKAVEELDLVGLLAVEMFISRDGRVLVNEMAPRPHNSGHWTMDAAYTDQFEQLVRAVCGLPLGSPERRCSATMKNLLGDDAFAWETWLSQPRTRLHLYGKSEARPGRKMGHVTVLGE